MTRRLSKKAMKELIPSSLYADRKTSFEIFTKQWTDSSKLTKPVINDDGTPVINAEGKVEAIRYLEFHDGPITLKFNLEKFSIRRVYGILTVQFNTDYYNSPEFNQMIPDLDECRVLLKNVKWD